MLQEFSMLNQYMTVILIRTDAERESKMHFLSSIIIQSLTDKINNFDVCITWGKKPVGGGGRVA
jgi:hypothetical protein